MIAHVFYNLGQVVGLHHVAPLGEDHFALVIHHVVEFQQLFTNVKIAALDLSLGAGQRLIDPRVYYRFAVFHAQSGQNFIQLFRAKDAHEVIFQTEKERRFAWISLTA